MSQRVFQVASFTPTAQADGVLTTGTWAGLLGGTTTQILKVTDFYMGGQAAATSVNSGCFARSSTLAITPTALALPNSDGALNSQAGVLTALPVSHVAAGTGPNRSPATTVARLNFTFNSFGGAVRVSLAQGEEWISVGNATTSNSESIYSCINVGTAGLQSFMVTYEVM